jgi:hypothetical protein
MFDILSNGIGVKVFLVNNIENKINGLQNNGIIILKKSASYSVLGHEIGHACKLVDIYFDKNNLVVTENISKLYIPSDCSGIEENLFYSTEKQWDVIQRLLMHGYSNDKSNCIDISFGDIYGIWYKLEDGYRLYRKALAPIGFQTKGTRDLSIYGGDN